MRNFTLHIGILSLLCGLMCATPSFADDEYAMDAKQITQAQTILVNLGQQKGTLPDGKMSDKTRDAIKGWQLDMKHPQTGNLTREEFDLLMQTDLNKYERIWSGVGASTDGVFVEVHGKKTGMEALSGALKGCRARSSEPEKCSTATGYGDKNGSWPSTAYYCKRKEGTMTYTHVYTISRATYEASLVRFQEAAKGDSFSSNMCRVLIAIDGTGKRY